MTLVTAPLAAAMRLKSPWKSLGFGGLHAVSDTPSP